MTRLDKETILVPLRLLLVSLLIFGVLYQGAIWAIGTTVWPENTHGSPVTYEGKTVGSELIGQQWTSDRYFHTRPSSIDYNAMTSGSAQLAPTNPELPTRVRANLRSISKYKTPDRTVPAVLVAESGSGLDPHISPTAARYQVPRVSNVTGIPQDRLYTMIDQTTEQPWVGIWGRERVNVMELNIKIDTATRQNQVSSERQLADQPKIEGGNHV